MPRSKQTNPTPKKGRPKGSGLIVPSWAHKQIAKLSALSGVGSQKILETSLRDGLQLVGEPLGSWITYQRSAEEQFNEHVKRLEKVGSQDEELAPAPHSRTDASEVFDLEPQRPREDAVNEGLDLSDEQSRHGAEAFADNGSLDGE